MPDRATVPLTAAAPLVVFSVKVEVVMLAAFIASEKVADTVVLIATLVALLAGLVELTVGAVVSVVVPPPEPPPPPPKHPASSNEIKKAGKYTLQNLVTAV